MPSINLSCQLSSQSIKEKWKNKYDIEGQEESVDRSARALTHPRAAVQAKYSLGVSEFWSKSEGSLRRRSSVPDSCYSGMPEVLRGDINSWQPGRKQGAKIPQPQWRFIPTHQCEQVPREDRGDRVRRCCPARPLLRQEVPHHLCHPVRVPAGGGVRRELQEELFHRV